MVTHTLRGKWSRFLRLFETIFGSSRSGGNFSGGFNINDIFGDLSGRGNGRTANKTRNKFESELSISIREAYEGTTKNVNLTYKQKEYDIVVKVPKGITRGKKLRSREKNLDFQEIFFLK